MLESPQDNSSKLSQQLQTLKEKREILTKLDAEIVDALNYENDLVEEITQADIYREGIDLAIRTVHQQQGDAVVHNASSEPEASSRDHVPPTSSTPRAEATPTSLASDSQANAQSRAIGRVKLPRLSFNGDLTTWTPFWDSFKSSIHDNDELTSIDKFNYLNSLLESSAAAAIARLTLSEANYSEAVAILTKRFGNRQQIVTKHMDALMGLEAVTSNRNLKGLRRLYDLVESHTGSLNSIEIPSSSYGSLLSSVFMNKLPREIRQGLWPMVQTRVLLDSGSQRSYISSKLCDELGLKEERKETLLVKTFAADEGRVQACRVVNFSVMTTDMGLSLLSILTICEPLTGQPITYLSGPDLADSGDVEDSLEVGVLIGVDQYWKIVTGKVVKGIAGPTAIETAFGLILSGPVPGLTLEPAVTCLSTVHLMKVDASVCSSLKEEIANLEGRLQAFWELDTLGIKESDTSVYDNLIESVSFQDSRYCVRLPWKSPRVTLPDNFDLSQKHLFNLLKRLRQTPHILAQYDETIQEQIRRGIVEVVNSSDIGPIGTTHYLPHHAVMSTLWFFTSNQHKGQRRGGDVVLRHNQLRDVFVDICHKANLGMRIEAGSALTPDLSRSRSVDALVKNWIGGSSAAFDVTVTSPLTPVSLQESSVTAGTAALLAEQRKHQANDPKCDTLGWKCIPLAVESYGNWGFEARQAFSHLASRLSFGIGHQKSKLLVDIYGRLNVTLVRCNARALLSRACNLF
eukprot:Em0009g213a